MASKPNSPSPDADCKKMKVSNDNDEQETKRRDLIAAIDNLDVKRAHELIQKNGTEGVCSVHLSRLLKCAMDTDNAQLVKDLLLEDPRLRTESGKSPLWAAVLTGSTKVAAMLIRSGADLTERHNFSNFLHVLVSSQEPARHELAMLMLERGADPKAKDAVGNSVLHCALRSNSPTLIEKLLEKGARIDEKNKYGECVLAQAAGRPDARQLIDVLLENGTTNARRRTLLKHVIMSCICRENVDLKAIRVLCASGFDLNSAEANGETFAYQAVEGGANEEAVELLIELGADVTRLTPRNLLNYNSAYYSRLELFIKRSVAEISKCKIFREEQEKFDRLSLIRIFYEKCWREIKQMECIMINENLPIRKIVTMSTKSLAWTMRNTNLIDIYEKNENHTKVLCPIYYDQIQIAFASAKKMKKVLDLKEEAFAEKLKNFLPHLVLEKIFFYMYMCD